MPLALTRGFTFRITPVSRYSKEFTLLPPSVVRVCVWIGYLVADLDGGRLVLQHQQRRRGDDADTW